MLQFPLPLQSEREAATDTATDLIRSLSTADLIAVIPVLARYAQPGPSRSQSSKMESYPFLSIPGTPREPVPVERPQAG